MSPLGDIFGQDPSIGPPEVARDGMGTQRIT